MKIIGAIEVIVCYLTDTVYSRGGTVHKIHGSVHITVLGSRFSVRLGYFFLHSKKYHVSDL